MPKRHPPEVKAEFFRLLPEYERYSRLQVLCGKLGIGYSTGKGWKKVAPPSPPALPERTVPDEDSDDDLPDPPGPSVAKAGWKSLCENIRDHNLWLRSHPDHSKRDLVTEQLATYWAALRARYQRLHPGRNPSDKFLKKWISKTLEK